MSPLCRFPEAFLARFTDLYTHTYMGQVSWDIFYFDFHTVPRMFRLHFFLIDRPIFSAFIYLWIFFLSISLVVCILYTCLAHEILQPSQYLEGCPSTTKDIYLLPSRVKRTWLCRPNGWYQGNLSVHEKSLKWLGPYFMCCCQMLTLSFSKIPRLK